MNFIPVLLIVILLLMLIISSAARNGGREPGDAWWLVIALVGLIGVLRAYQFINNWSLWLIYGGMVSVNYLLTYYAAYFLYKDPVSEYKGDLSELRRKKIKIHYVIPVYNEPKLIIRCVQSIITSVNFVKDFAQVEIVVVNDASTDDTWERLQVLAGLPGVYLMNLQKNVGKKGAITAGTYGGENWRDAFVLFEERFGRKAGKQDHEEIVTCLREVKCSMSVVDLYFHTDSDSVVSKEFIRYMIMGFLTDERIGAISGHCDVLLEEGVKPSFFTMLQIAWYFTQFRIRKAAESSFNAVFCVSGPGAGFRSATILHLLPQWVDDEFGGKIYKGATDRMLTLRALMDGWKVKYSALAKVWTAVPSTPDEARRQWTRWKQNFWRMLILVWKFAWKTHPVVAYLTYSRLVVTILAPFILAYHLVLLLLGDVIDSILYLTGIAVMGSLMGLAFLTRNPDSWQFALLRPLIGLLSAFWGSILTLRAFYFHLMGAFIWREVPKSKKPPSRIARWLGFEPTFEVNFFLIVFLITVVIYVMRFYFNW